MKEEALKLADELDRMVLSDDWGDMAKYYGWFKENASPTIRQLVDELDKQGEPVAWMSPDGKVSTTEGKLFYIPLYTAPQTKPLSDDEIKDIANANLDGHTSIRQAMWFARAIEERHGIK